MSETNSTQVAMSRPFLYVAAGRDEVALWNAEDGSCQQVIRVVCDPLDVDYSESPAALSCLKVEGSKKCYYRLEELNEPPQRHSGFRALLPLSAATGLLTAGTDCKIRLWDQLRPDKSYIVSGPVGRNSTVLETYKYETRTVSGVQILQETCSRQPGSKTKRCFAVAATDTTGCHRDSVLSLASAQTNQRIVISSCRDGSVKVWK